MSTCSFRQPIPICIIFLICHIPAGVGFAQSGAGQTKPLVLPFPITTEFSESINPWSGAKLVTDSYKLAAGTKNLRMQFSNQAPSVLGGKQFQGLPGGYRMSEVSLTRRWGKIHAFRSLGFSSRLVRPESARNISGAAVEAPKSLLGANITAYVLRATPAGSDRPSLYNPLAGSSGSQFGLTLARELRKGTRFQAEWTQTKHTVRGSGTGDEPSRRGFLARLDSTIARTSLNFTCLSTDEGMANPAIPAYGPARRIFSLDAGRKFRRHQLQYSSRSEGQRAVPNLHTVVRDVFEESIRWTYAPGRMPQISASQSWSRQTASGNREMEAASALSLSKGLGRLRASLMFFRGARSNLRTSLPIWNRNVLSGDATIEISKNRRIHIRYDRSYVVQRVTQQSATGTTLQLDTRVDLWTGRLSVAPAVDIRRQDGSIPALDAASLRFVLSSIWQLPRHVPGTELMINFGSHYAGSAGRPGRGGSDLSIRWSFRRQ